MNISQISLVCAILSELERQAAVSGQEARCSVRQLNVITAAATTITEALCSTDKPAETGMGLQKWLASDDTGTSSLTMAAVLFKAGKYASTPHNWCHPWDPGDFGRCHRFLEAVPGARALMLQMAEVSPEWKVLVEHWDELTTLYLAELPTGRAPQCYDLIKELIQSTAKSG